MKRVILGVLLVLSVALVGCTFSEWALSNIGGWDLSACGESSSSFGTCWEVYWDNVDRFAPLPN